MTTDFVQLFKDQNAQIKTLGAAEPEMLQGFMGLKTAVFEDGSLSAKTKDLLALVIGVASQCEPCIAHYANALVKHGLSREELTEALNVCVLMGGGPKLQYASKALTAFDQFKAV